MLVGRGEHAVERGDVGVGHRARFDLADVVLVEQRDEPVDLRVDALERGRERAVVEAAEDRAQVPARRRLGLGSGHVAKLDARA